MSFYKAVCAKNNQKIELLVQFESLDEARESLHKQGYSIIEIKQTENFSDSWEVYFFDFTVDWKIKTWSINSNDILKAYIKLIDDLNYNIKYIYVSKEDTEDEKKISTEKIRHSYEIYKSKNRDSQLIKKEEKKDKDSKDKWNDDINSILLKELDYYYNLIDKVLEKINFIIDNFWDNLTQEKKIKLNDLYNSLKKIKNITNITKLKLIWETALLKIWELQMELISLNIIEWKKEILSDTNKLLKSFGSYKQILLPEDDIKLIIKNWINNFIKHIKNFINWWEKTSDKIDKNSWKYFNILRELQIYKQKLKEINKEIIYNFFNKDKKLRLLLKKKFIKQNISLITNRIKNKKISYTKTIKWLTYYKDILIYLIQKTWDLFIYIIFIYSLFFILINSYNNLLNLNLNLNLNFLLQILFISILWFLLKISKNISFLVFSIIFYIVIFIYLIVNF